MAKNVLLLLFPLLLCGCRDSRYASLAEGVRQTHELVLSEPIKKLTATFKGSPAEQRLQALYSVDGNKLWPPREKIEFSFVPPNPSAWPSRIVLLDRPDSPWSVVVRVKGPQQLEISSYAIDLEKAESVEVVDL